MKSFANAQNYIMKAESTVDIPDKTIVLAKLQSCTGLCHLSNGMYKNAAKSFLETSYELGSNFSEVSSIYRRAIYQLFFIFLF